MPTFSYFGDGVATIDGGKAKSQTLISTGNSSGYYVYGDAAFLIGGARGGSDVIFGESGEPFQVPYMVHQLYGDSSILEFSAGGNDQIFGGNSVIINDIYGDASDIFGGKGGNDQLTGGSNSGINNVWGDASYMVDATDRYGQVRISHGGNDVLIGGSGNQSNRLIGDAEFMVGGIGGNDLLIGGAFNAVSVMYGDASAAMSGTAGGNDRLISGECDDLMWGDFRYFETGDVVFGNDIFVFKSNNGSDLVQDFRNGDDKIELAGIAGVDDFYDLQISVIGGDSVIKLSADDSIMVVGVTDLQAQDFIFS